MTLVTLYGIPNCDTVKKARVWLERRGVAYRFHDLRADGVSAGQVEAWARELGWDKVLNKASTTFRALPEESRAGLDGARAVALMVAQPTMIKRPVLDLGDRRLLGFKPETYAAAFSA